MEMNTRQAAIPVGFELEPAQPDTEQSDYQVESNRQVEKRPRRAVFDDGVRVGSKDRH
jgi:hypothetical protein